MDAGKHLIVVGAGPHGRAVAAGSVVPRSVPPLGFAAGAPARLRRRLTPPLDYRGLLAAGPGLLQEDHHAA